MSTGAMRNASLFGTPFFLERRIRRLAEAQGCLIVLGKLGVHYFPVGLGMSGLPDDGLTVALLSGILSRPPSIFSSLPPDVDVPLPLAEELEPTVGAGSALGFALLAAGSPLVEPRPLGLPCAKANP